MKKFRKVLWGLLFIAVGCILALNACNVTNIDIFFDGWWTLFIIVPCFIGLFNEREKTGNLIGLAIGVFLLLCCQDILSFGALWKLLIPAIIVVIGLKMIYSAFYSNKAEKIMCNVRRNGDNVRVGCATFSGQDLRFDGEVFTGAELTAIFGGVNCDLRSAFIEQDCGISATSVFGGIDIFVPDNVNVKVNSNSIFGGVSNKKGRENIVGAPTVYINATCMFGGVDIK
ncbi:MAG: LiaF transmembrane domain-containing protein [Faecousia sp.]